MFGFISKRKLLKKMKEIKDGCRKEKLGVKYPPETEKQEHMNLYLNGYEDGTDNFYNALAHFMRK
jgi:hypothetical protein